MVTQPFIVAARTVVFLSSRIGAQAPDGFSGQLSPLPTQPTARARSADEILRRTETAGVSLPAAEQATDARRPIPHALGGPDWMSGKGHANTDLVPSRGIIQLDPDAALSSAGGAYAIAFRGADGAAHRLPAFRVLQARQTFGYYADNQREGSPAVRIIRRLGLEQQRP